MRVRLSSSLENGQARRVWLCHLHDRTYGVKVLTICCLFSNVAYVGNEKGAASSLTWQGLQWWQACRGHAGLLAILATQCRSLWQQAQSGEIKRALNPGSSHHVIRWWLRCGSNSKFRQTKHGLGRRPEASWNRQHTFRLVQICKTLGRAAHLRAWVVALLRLQGPVMGKQSMAWRAGAGSDWVRYAHPGFFQACQALRWATHADGLDAGFVEVAGRGFR